MQTLLLVTGSVLRRRHDREPVLSVDGHGLLVELLWTVLLGLQHAHIIRAARSLASHAASTVILGPRVNAELRRHGLTLCAHHGRRV